MTLRLVALKLALLAAVALGSVPCGAADGIAGSLGVTSDYLVRGISRTNDQAALQLDVYYAGASGFLLGAFASNSQINSNESRDAELSAFVGFAWNLDADWRSKILLSHYAYPWNQAGTHYNYDEADLDLTYQGWLHVSLEYSPNTPRYLASPYNRLIGVTQKSAELSLQRPIVGRFSAAAGVGYSYLDGADAAGYAYWSAGAAYDWRSLSLALAYVNTSAQAKVLFYNAAATGRWAATVIWRF